MTLFWSVGYFKMIRAYTIRLKAVVHHGREHDI